jgi:hypothetical protein
MQTLYHILNSLFLSFVHKGGLTFKMTKLILQADKNVELRKKKPGYQAYDEFDDAGEVGVNKSSLSRKASIKRFILTWYVCSKKFWAYCQNTMKKLMVKRRRHLV